jgi:hypothetical protein
MKISGFTIIRNAVMNDYPILEAIRSILPVVDEMLVLVGDSSDGTLGLIQSINDPKIKIHHSVWDTSLRAGGAVLAVETNKAFQLIDPSSDWAFYIQGDEAVHEQYHETIRNACLAFKDDSKVEGLLFKYLHFYGTFDYVGDSRKWYHREVRIIKNNKKIKAYKDAQGFRVGDEERKIAVKQIDAYIYHYGWVKSLEQMIQKQKYVSQFWVGEEQMQKVMESENFFNFSDFDSLAKFTGTHPSVMHERIENKNLHVDLNIQQKKFSFKDKLLYYFEKTTGIRPFDFKNYRVLR